MRKMKRNHKYLSILLISTAHCLGTTLIADGYFFDLPSTQNLTIRWCFTEENVLGDQTEKQSVFVY